MAKKKSAFHKSNRSDAERRVNQANRLGRVLKTLQLIQGRGRWNAKEIARELGWAERTVYRDLIVLEAAGVPCYFDQELQAYRISEGWRFPTINLSNDELVGLAIATTITRSPGLDVGTGAKATTQKLSATSKLETQELIEDAEQLIQVLDLKLADHSRHADKLRIAQWALLERKQLIGEYKSPYLKDPVKLSLHPYRLCLTHQAWYLIAKDAKEPGPRVYRIMRFTSLAKSGHAADVPGCFDLREYFGNAWAVYRGKESYAIELLFSKEAAPLVTETKWHSTQEEQWHRNGAVTLRFQVDGLDEIVWWVLGWSGRATVLEPALLREMVIAKLREALTLNGET